MYDDNKFLDEISSKLKDKNINSDYIIVRSAFNGEDLEGFSAAGLYDSCITTVDEVVPTINHVAESKNSKRACAVRAMHQIPDSAILPSIIIQEYIPADFQVQRLRAEYKRQAVLGDRIFPLVSKTEDSYVVALCNEEKEPYAVVEFS